MIFRFKQFEGKYDKITGISVDEIWKIIKITKIIYNIKPKGIVYDDDGFLENQINYDFIEPVEYDLFLRVKREKIDNKLGFIIEGYSESPISLIVIELIIDPDKEPYCYKELNSYLQDTVRHEIEHLTHAGYNRLEDRPDPKKSLRLRNELNRAHERGVFVNSYKYYLLEDEIGPLVHGMYRKAKTDKKPITVIFNEFLDIMSNENIINNDRNRQKVYDAWISYAKKNLPVAKYE